LRQTPRRPEFERALAAGSPCLRKEYSVVVTNLLTLGVNFLRRRKPGTPDTDGHPLAPHPVLGQPRYLKKLSTQGNKHRPILLICETVNICNNDCVICPYGAHDRKKSVMPMPLFAKVVRDYAEMGGGTLSLTPTVGEVFLDKHLPERIRLVAAEGSITNVTITTNATHADRFTGDELSSILRHVRRVHISVYGLDREEHVRITRRDDHDRVLDSIRALIAACDDPAKIAFGFRMFRSHEDAVLRAWMREQFGREYAVSSNVLTYANWGGTFDTSKPLPDDATWLPARRNTEQCLIPLLSYQVFVDGGVSFCPCCDYNATDEFALGNVAEKSLLEICNSPRVRELWNVAVGNRLPEYCRNCTFHVPLASLPQHEYMFDDPVRFFGG
jgi:radical SAM protein with 4Fe4S-binding SPASM domain